MKLIIDVEKDYWEMIKYNVEHGQEYKPFEIIANGAPYEENPQGDLISREALKEVFNGYHSGIGSQPKFTLGACLQLIDNAPTVSPEKALMNKLKGGEEE